MSIIRWNQASLLCLKWIGSFLGGYIYDSYCAWDYGSGKTKVLYDSAVQKLLDEVGLSRLDAANVASGIT